MLDGLQYQSFDFNRLNGINFSALCRNLVRFGPITRTPKFTLLKMTTFVVIWQKSTYHTKCLRISWTDQYQLYRFGRHMGGDD